MQLTKNSFLLIFFICQTILSKDAYVPVLHPNFCSTQKHGDVSVSTQAFSGQECRKFFGSNIVTKGYRPLIVQIVNKTLRTLKLSPGFMTSSLHDESLELIDPCQILHQIKYNCAIYALATIPAAFYVYWQAIPFFAFACFSLHQYNKNIENDLLKGSIHPQETIVISPFQNIRRIAFISEDHFLAQFTITLVDEIKREALEFSFNLLGNQEPHLNGLTLE